MGSMIEARKKYHNAYQTEHYKTVSVTVNRDKDADVLARLAEHKNVSEYVRTLVKKDINNAGQWIPCSERLIDADALYKSFGASGNCNNCPLDAYKCQYYNEHTLMEFCERIDDAPTVDAVEVVRCKDCRWFENDGYHTNCQIMRFCVEADDYCSRGERREDGAT